MEDEIRLDDIKDFLSSRNLGVLATSGAEFPYPSLVAVAFSNDLRTAAFATMKKTCKYGNITRSPNVSILVNSGKNVAEDFSEAVSVTVLGRAFDAETEKNKGLRELYLSKFPFLKGFVDDPGCALIRVEIKKMIMVTRFQEVREIDL